MNLVSACIYGKLDIVIRYKNYNVRDKWGRVPLVMACRNHRIEIVEHLLKNKAEPDMKDSDKLTGLVVASNAGNFDIVKLLISYGADVNVKDGVSYTPVMYAAEDGRLDIVDFLVSKGAKLNTESTCTITKGLTGLALMYAAQAGHIRIVKYLHGKGSFINNRTLMYACEDGRNEVVMFLLDHVDEINRKSAAGYSPLSLAHFHGREIVVDLLITEYLEYVIKIKVLLKYIGLENIFGITRKIIESEIDNEKINDVVYS